MKLLSRLLRTPTPPPATPAVEPPPVTAEPAPPAVDPEEQQQLLHAIESGSLESAELMRLAVEGQTTRLRQAAVAAIQDPASWQALLPSLRGRDKAAYKLIKQRLDALLAEQRNQAQAKSDAEALCASIERHAAKPHDALFAPTLSLFTARWQALPVEIDAAIRQRGKLAFERGQEVVAAHERGLARSAAEHAAEQAQARALEAELLAQRQAADEHAAADASEQAMADQAREAEVQAEIQAEAQALSEKQAANAQTHAEIASLIRLSGAALGRGDTRKSARFRQSIEAALPNAPPLPPHLARNLEQLDTRLNELRQWKDYVVAPKRIELIEEVEALIAVDELPAPLMEHLRALRQEWRTINKGLAVEATDEAQRFERAYTAAFRPCQVYLAEQAAIRRTNLDARKQVLARVQTFEAGLDAEHPDHPLIARVLREAPQEWRSHAPVDRDASRPLDAEFFGTLDRLRAKVTTWYAGNTAAKQTLITRALQLTTSADLSRAIDEVKRLQAQWKTTGPVPHAQSQALWDEFRALCNAVYERRQQEFAQQSATLEQAKSAAEDLCKQIEQASQEGPADRASGEASLREWQAAFHNLSELPRNEGRNLHERYQRAMTAYDSQIAGLAQRAAEAVETNALAAARHVRAYQRAVIQGDPARDELKTAAEAFIAGVPRWPNKRILQALRQALTRADSAEFMQPDDAARELALRQLCIRAEILSGAATPPEDARLRREQEMQMLQQGLGQARQADDRAWDAMRIEWLGLDATEPAVHDELERRFNRCLYLFQTVK
ncbi:MAG: DUF349 domain-containing protein [Pseudomonadota bacterium]